MASLREGCEVGVGWVVSVVVVWGSGIWTLIFRMKGCSWASGVGGVSDDGDADGGGGERRRQR